MVCAVAYTAPKGAALQSAKLRALVPEGLTFSTIEFFWRRTAPIVLIKLDADAPFA
jgi:hypothetical protein